MNNKVVPIVIIVAVIVAILLYFFAFKSSEVTNNKDTDVLNSNNNVVEQETRTDTTKKFDVPTSENPGDQGDVKNQPAYLWLATTTRVGTHNLGVDYVLVFDGEEAIHAQIEDGLCTDASSCKTGQYIRNNNAHHRTFKLSSTTPVVIEVNGVIKNALETKGISKTEITFDELKEVLPTLPAFSPKEEIYFKEAKTFVYLDIIGGEVTKIIEP